MIKHVFFLMLSFVVFQHTAFTQVESELTNDNLSIINTTVPMKGANYGLSSFNIQDDFNFVSGSLGQLTAGSDVRNSIIGELGLSVNEFLVVPSRSSFFGIDNLGFQYFNDGIGFFDNWTIYTLDEGSDRRSLVFNESFGSDAIQTEDGLILKASDVLNGGIKVGIGTNDPLSKLEVNQTNTQKGIIGKMTYPAGTNSDFAAIYGENSVDDYYGYGVRGKGFIGVLGESSPTGNEAYYGVLGQVFGGSGTNYSVYGETPSGTGTNYSGYFPGDVTVLGIFNNPSDGKLKENVLALNNTFKKSGISSIDKLNALQPKTYTYKKAYREKMGLPGKAQFGFIAQDVQQVFPELVKQNVHSSPKDKGAKEEFLGINYIGLIPILTSGLQELSAENTRLKKKNSDLETRLAKLEATVQSLLNK